MRVAAVKRGKTKRVSKPMAVNQSKNNANYSDSKIIVFMSVGGSVVA